MLFTYQYIPHAIEKLQEYLDFLFYDVWLVAEGCFNFSKLANPSNNDEFKKICELLELEDTEWGNFFNSRIAWIYDEFAKIDDDVFKLELIDLYSNNNDIETLCKSKVHIPISYADLSGKYPELEKALKSFYSRLYGSESPFNLKAFDQLNKKLIPSHYEDFMKVNNDEICPFCGLLPIKGNNHSYREAYDHYLPKGVYPFNVLNFKNLAPMCHECNSTYKLKDDPIYEDYKKIDPLQKEDKRQLAFYPYSTNHPAIQIDLKLKTNDVLNLKPNEIELTIDVSTHIEETESWKRVFGIDERYYALLCGKHKAKEWFEDVFDDFENAKTLSDVEDAEKYYAKVIRATTRNTKSAENTLKRKFLEECKRLGLLSAKVTTHTPADL